jgi:hypothetical protein
MLPLTPSLLSEQAQHQTSITNTNSKASKMGYVMNYLGLPYLANNMTLTKKA